MLPEGVIQHQCSTLLPWSLAAFAAPSSAGQRGLGRDSKPGKSACQVLAKAVPAFQGRLDWRKAICRTESISVLMVLVEHCYVLQLCLLFW